MPRLPFAITLACCLPALTGCGGPKLVPVNGTVTIDGKPVDGATVTFVSDDGKHSFSGSTDASGNYSLQEGEKTGAYPGSYKVIVIKNPHKATAEALDPAGAESMKMMKKEAEEALKTGKTGSNDQKMKMMTKGGGGPSGATTAPAVKSELPAVYASGSSTPLNAKVEKGDQTVTVNLELKSK